MILKDLHHWHGKCFIKRFGIEKLAELSTAQLGCLTLNDIGPVAMKRLLNIKYKLV